MSAIDSLSNEFQGDAQEASIFRIACLKGNYRQFARQFIQACHTSEALVAANQAKLAGILQWLKVINQQGNQAQHSTLLLRCYTSYPAAFTENERADFRSTLENLTLRFTKVESLNDKQLGQLRKVVSALASRADLLQLPQVARFVGTQVEVQIPLEPLQREAHLRLMPACLQAANAVVNFEFPLSGDYFSSAIQLFSHGFLFAEGDPRRQNVDFLLGFWIEVARLPISQVRAELEKIFFPLINEQNVQRLFSLVPADKLREAYHNWMRETLSDKVLLQHSRSTGESSLSIRAALQRASFLPAIQQVGFDGVAALQDFVQQNPRKTFSDVRDCELFLPRPLPKAEIAALLALFPNLKVLGSKGINLTDLADLVQNNGIESLVIYDEGVCLDAFPVERFSGRSLLFPGGARVQKVRCKAAVVESNATVMLFQTGEFQRAPTLDFSQCVNKDQITDSFMRKASSSGLLLAKSQINLSGCLRLTDAALYGLIAKPKDLKSLSLVGCHGISENAILALIATSTDLELLTLPKGSVLDQTSLSEIRQMIYRKLVHSYPEPFWRHGTFTIQSLRERAF